MPDEPRVRESWCVTGRELSGGTDGGVHYRRRQAVPVRLLAHHPRQAGAGEPAVPL